MKRFFFGFVFLLGLVIAQGCSQTVMPQKNNSSSSEEELSSMENGSSSTETTRADSLDLMLTPVSELASFFENQESNKQVLVKGVITRLLADDTDGDAHQRFIIKLDNEQRF